MKKRFMILVAVIMIAAMVLCACGSSGGGSSQGGEKTTLKFATGGTTGAYYPYGGAVAQVVQDKVENVSFDVQATGASKANIRLIANKEADIALVQNDVMSYAYTGTELFEGEKIESFATVATVYAEVVQIVVDPASGINSIADLKGKRVSVGDAGSGVEVNAKQILAAYGISFDDITVQNMGFGDSANAMKDKKLDAFFVTAGTPTTAITELSVTNNIKILSIDADKMNELMNNYSFYTEYTIPANTYTGVTEDVKTLAVKATIIVRSDLEEELVYNITKALFEGKDALAEANAKGAELNKDDAVKGVSVPFHAGAEKYFKEINVIE